MSEIRLICLDMDGTLLDDDHATVPPRNVAALRAASERGAAVAIASGRAWALLQGVHAQIGVTRYAVLSNGAAVLDIASGEWLYRRPMDPSARRTILTLLLDWGLPFEVYCEGENYIQHDRTEQVVSSALSPEFSQVLRTCSHFPEDLNAALEGKDVEKIHIFHVPPERRQELLDAVAACGPLAVTTSFGENMELTAPGVNKGSAVQALCARLDNPFFALAKSVGVEGAFQRVESIVAALWVLSDFALLGLLTFALRHMAGAVCGESGARWAPWAGTGLAFAGGMLLFPDDFAAEMLAETVAPLGNLVLAFVLPALALWAGWLRGRKK